MNDPEKSPYNALKRYSAGRWWLKGYRMTKMVITAAEIKIMSTFSRP